MSDPDNSNVAGGLSPDEEEDLLGADGGEAPSVLDQSAIDALMAEAASEPSEVVYKPNGERFPYGVKVPIEIYDFRNPVFLTEMELRQVRIRHEQFIHYLGARMSMFLRMDFILKMSKLYTAQYSKFTQQIPNPASISLFKLSKMQGIGVLSINSRLAMTVADRMLGGKGHSVREERYLTEIETALMDDVVQIFLEEWCRQWEDTESLEATPVGHENNGRFLQTSTHDAIMLVLCMEGSLGDCSEEILIGVPYYTIEPMIKRMQENNRRFHAESSTESNTHWRNSYAHISVPVTAEWDACEATVGDVISLRVGDVIELPQEVIGQTVISIVNSPRFIGEVGLDDERVIVKITEELPDPGDEERDE